MRELLDAYRRLDGTKKLVRAHVRVGGMPQALVEARGGVGRVKDVVQRGAACFSKLGDNELPVEDSYEDGVEDELDAEEEL